MENSLVVLLLKATCLAEEP